MLFINPMWDNEAERIGKQRCTRFGYALHTASDLIGFVGLLLLVGIAAYLGYRSVVGTFHTRLFWLISIPLGIAIVGSILYRLSWAMAHRRGFRYNYESCEASWVEDGQRRIYRYNDAA
jgi:hypothetical protein